MARNIDKYNLYDHILLNEGAYFFKRGNASISKVSIEELFSSVAKELVVLARKVRVRETVHEKSVFCSLLVVKMSAIPRFLMKLICQHLPKSCYGNKARIFADS